MKSLRLALVALALALPACANVVDALAPKTFYGFASSVQGQNVLCLTDARDDDRDRERCFQVSPGAAQGLQLQRGDLLKVTYDAVESEQAPAEAIAIEEVNPNRPR
jgi:hypothetical protein